jgi:uncharacterized protein YqeY
MSLKKRIAAQLTERIKAKDVVGKSTLRMLVAAVKNREIETGSELDDQETMRVIARQASQRREAIRLYEQGGRRDLVLKEEAELDILMSFMPEQLSEEGIGRVVVGVIEEIDATGMQDMGRVMKTVMAKLAGSADGKLVNEIVKNQLSA